ncbi:MAG: PmoA family protein [Verrucomicrobiota bacterium]
MVFLPIAVSAADTAVKLTKLEDRVRIEIGGKLFTEYRYVGAPKPCLFPILDAEGVSYTRNWPMKDVPDEIHDHDWHRSVWFGHGLVNGHDFWRELKDKPTGTIVHEALLEAQSGPTGQLRARSRWVSATGETICTDETTYRFRRVPEGYLLDCEIAIKASHGALTFGDTEEGAMAVRVNEAIRVTQAVGKKKTPGTGTIVNASGDRGTKAWGKRAPWTDYHGPLPNGGPTIGVAIFDHPKNPSHPTWWHVRDYGLFAANPFGKHDFEKLKDQPNAGDIKVPAGSEFVVRYRILFHRGDEKQAKVADHYQNYAAGK